MRELGCPKTFVCDGHMGECTIALYNEYKASEGRRITICDSAGVGGRRITM